MPCFALLLFLLIIAVGIAVLVAGLVIGVGGLVTTILLLRNPKVAEETSPSTTTRRPWFRRLGLTGGILCMLIGALMIVAPLRWEYDFLIGDNLRTNREWARREATRSAMQKDVETLGAAELAYQAVNGGFFDIPSCLSRPDTCIPGHRGQPFASSAISSLKNREGYEVAFFAGPTLPRQMRKNGRISPTSVAAFAFVARAKTMITEEDPPGHKIKVVDETSTCIDSRGKACDIYKLDPEGGFCPCTPKGAQPEVVQPAVLGFTHVDGKDPCPQRVGSIQVYNATDAEITTDVRYVFEPSGRMVRKGTGRLPAAPLSLDGDPIDMPGGSSWDSRGIPIGGWSNARIPARGGGHITIDYNCTAKNDFAIDVFVMRDQDKPKVTIYGTINP